MKKINVLLLVLVGLFAFTFESKSQVNPSSTYVSGYTKADGTYVSGHYKTTSNSTNRDNYTTKPNSNPYTGKAGYIEPDSRSLSSPVYRTTTPSISTGPRGGQYYINSNRNKTYIKQ